MSENRRSTARYDVSVPAEVAIGDQSHALTITNLSLGGAFFQAPEKLLIGTKVAVSFEIPGRTEPIKVGAQVRWVADSGAGVQFEGLRAAEVWSLNQFFTSLAKPSES